MTTPEDRGPGVPVPPPVQIGVLVLIAWGLHRLSPLPLGFTAPGLGAVVIALALGLIGWALLTMRRAGTDPRPDRPDQALVEAGPFRRTRNPIYLGFLLIVLGLAISWGDMWAFLTVFAAFSTLDRFIIPREEAYLQTRFGRAYAGYAARTRRWL